MNSIKSVIVVLLVGAIVGGLSGCNSRARNQRIFGRVVDIRVEFANLEPTDVDIVSPVGGKVAERVYGQKINMKDVVRDRFQLPPITFSRDGYADKTMVFDSILINRRKYWSRAGYNLKLHHSVAINDKVDLAPIDNCGMIVLTINSEPKGSQIYSSGRYVGVSPVRLKYYITEKDFENGYVNSDAIACAYTGYLPDTQNIRLNLEPEWKDKKGKFEYATVFLLKCDPGYTPEQNVTINNPIGQGVPSNITIKKEKDALDVVEQGANTYLLLNAIKMLR